MIAPSKTSFSKPQEQPPPNPSRPRKSYYFTRDLNLLPNDAVGKSYDSAPTFPDPPRKSSKQRIRKRNSRPSPKRVTSSSAGCSCRPDSVWTKSPEYSSSPLGDDENEVPSAESFDGMVSTWCSCKVNSISKQNDIVIEVDDKSFKTQFDSISDLHHLPPIITKPANFNDTGKREQSKEWSPKDSHSVNKPLSVKVVKEHKTNAPARKLPGNSPGVRLRIHSPKIGSRKIQGGGRRSASSSRRSISDSCAVVKSSLDPQRDFRESMMEMIVENNLRASKDLEDLLACYLSLNSDEYHDLIIKVFKQIWFHLSDLTFN